jgi:pyruvate kinase
MQTIAILPEPTADSLSYRATCGQHQATGQTPGQALDTLEAELATTSTDSGETLVILQRFRPDDLFTAAQQQLLRKLMDKFQAAITQGTQLAPTVQSELDTLVEAELEANIQRSQRLLQQRDMPTQHRRPIG